MVKKGYGTPADVAAEDAAGSSSSSVVVAAADKANVAREMVAYIRDNPDMTAEEVAEARPEFKYAEVCRIKRQVRMARIHSDVVRLADQYLTDMDDLRLACANRIKAIGDRVQRLEKMSMDDDVDAMTMSAVARSIADSERNLLAFMNTLTGTLSKSEFAEFVRRMRAAAAATADINNEAHAVEGVTPMIVQEIVEEKGAK